MPVSAYTYCSTTNQFLNIFPILSLCIYPFLFKSLVTLSGFPRGSYQKKISWASGWDFFIFKVGLGFYSKVSKTKKGSPGPPSRQGLPGCLKVGSCLGLMLWQLNDVRWCLLFFIAFYVCCLMFHSLLAVNCHALS